MKPTDWAVPSKEQVKEPQYLSQSPSELSSPLSPDDQSAPIPMKFSPYQSHLRARLRRIYERGVEPDFKLVVGTKHIMVHKTVLFLFTDFFTSCGSEYEVKNISYSIMDKLVQLLYLGFAQMERREIPLLVIGSQLIGITGVFVAEDGNQIPVGDKLSPDDLLFAPKFESLEVKLEPKIDLEEGDSSSSLPVKEEGGGGGENNARFADMDNGSMIDNMIMGLDEDILEDEEWTAPPKKPRKKPGRKPKVKMLLEDDEDDDFGPLMPNPDVKLKKRPGRKPASKEERTCPTCNRECKSRSHLATHMKTHTGEKDYICQYCEKSFILQSSLQRHEMLHTGENMLYCKFCSKKFNNPGNLKTHERTHTQERLFMCNTCGRSFMEKNHLKRHMNTHTGEKPHKCRFCERGFSDKRDTIKHEKKVHNFADPILKCRWCEEWYSDRRMTVKHEKEMHPDQMARFKYEFSN